MTSPSVKAPPSPGLPARPSRQRVHGQTRVDPYAWATDPRHPDLRRFIRESNRHAAGVLKPLTPLIRRLDAELAALTPPVEGAAPFRHGKYVYHFHRPADCDHPRLVRWPAARPDRPRTVLDVNDVARGHRFCVVPFYALSPDGRFVAYAVDLSGNRRYTLCVHDIQAGCLLPDRIRNADCHFGWRRDGRAVVYASLDRVNQRPARVCLHELGTPRQKDRTLYREGDEAFRCLIQPTNSGQFLRIVCFSGDTEDVKLLRTADPEAGPFAATPRAAGVVYDLDHGGGLFTLRTNRERGDFSVFVAKVPGLPPERWRPIGPRGGGVFVERMTAFRRHVVLAERRRGRLRLRVLSPADGRCRILRFPDPVCEAWVEPVPGMSGRTARIGYTSLLTPLTYYDGDLDSGHLRRVQQEQVPGYRPRDYTMWQGWASARDGARIPFTAVRRRRHGPRCAGPALVFAYGAYGTNMPPWFDEARLPLLDRGFIYVLAHIRGGSELGQAWYEAGRGARKANSARDVADCVLHLAAAGLADRDAVFVETLSAGGIAVGGAIHLAPGLLRGAILHAPSVDPLTSMAAPDVPLTLSEYAEWGDPAVAADWLNMRAYSPYDNVRPAHLPALMVTANLNDSQVPFWEPVRWVARLRAANRGRNPVLLLTYRHADHDGPSGRSRRRRERAVEWAFLLSLLPDATRPEAPSHCAPCRARRGCGSASPGSPRP